MNATLGFGPIQLTWRFDPRDPRWAPFRTAYGAWLSDAVPHLVIDAEAGAPAANSAGPPLTDSLIRCRTVNGRDFDLGEGLVRGTVSGQGQVECTIAPILLSGVGLRVLEQFFYLLFYEAALGGAAHESAAPFLMHGAAVLSGDRVHVFSGPPQAGKSTAAANSRPRAILTDECVAIIPGPGGPRAAGTPVNPSCAERTPGEGPLGAVHLLEKASAHALLPIATAQAVPRLVPEIMLPLRLLETDLGLGMARALDRALLLCRARLVHLLRLRPDPGFWSLLEESRAGR